MRGFPKKGFEKMRMLGRRLRTVSRFVRHRTYRVPISESKSGLRRSGCIVGVYGRRCDYRIIVSKVAKVQVFRSNSRIPLSIPDSVLIIYRD